MRYLVLTLLLVGCTQVPSARNEATAADAGPGTALAEALASFTASIERSERATRASASFGSDAEQAGGYLQIARAMIKALEAEVLQDPDYPYFRVLDFWLSEGGDNADQRYAFSPVRGGAAYRVWGRLGSAKRLELQLYAGRPWDGSGRSAGYLAFEDIGIRPDGSFEIFVGGEARARSWLANPEEATTLFARHIYDEWNEERPGEIHIDRVGFEGNRKPMLTSAELAERYRRAATMFETTARTWPAFVQKRYFERLPVNTLSPLIDTYALGGAKGRWMASGHFDLPPGKVLVLRSWPTTAAYQGVQLTNLWYAALEHGNRVSSLTTKQMEPAPDGAYYSIVSPVDPGHPNWLDSGGLTRGVILMRFDGVQGTVPESQHPSAELVDLDELETAVPGFRRVTEAEREAVRAARRHHLQLRSGR